MQLLQKEKKEVKEDKENNDEIEEDTDDSRKVWGEVHLSYKSKVNMPNTTTTMPKKTPKNIPNSKTPKKTSSKWKFGRRFFHLWVAKFLIIKPIIPPLGEETTHYFCKCCT